MKISSTIAASAVIVSTLGSIGCAKNAAPAEDASSEGASAEEAPAEPLGPVHETSKEYFVEGVAGGVMINTVELEAEVISVDQEKREAVLRGPEGNEVVVRVGKDAVNFYQVKAGARVRVAMARELVIYVPDEEQEVEDGTAVAGARAEEGATPAGAVVAKTKITAKIASLDPEARKATLTFPDGRQETYDVRPDVDMSKYQAGQDVVFLITELLAMEVTKL